MQKLELCSYELTNATHLLPPEAGNHQKLEKAKKDSSPGPRQEQGPSDTFILDFRPSELLEKKFLLF